MEKVILSGLGVVLWLLAAEPIRSQPSVQFEFLPPELEGTYSLGIYDQKGTLVRTLAKAASESAFKVGLNGFVASWNGRTDDNGEAPKGRYLTRGYVVPNVAIEPITADSAPPRAEPISIFRDAEVVGINAADEPFVIGAGSDGSRKIWIENSGTPALHTVEGLGAGATSAAEIVHPQVKGICVGCADGLFMLDPANWKAAQLFEAVKPVWVAFQGDTIVTIFGTEFGTTGLSELDTYQKEEIPPGFRPIPGPDATMWYLVGADGAIFKKPRGSAVLTPFAYEKFGKLVAAAAGTAGSIWLVETAEGGAWELRQFAADGEFLRQLPGSATTILSLAASTKSETLALLRKETDGAVQLVKLTHKPSAEEGEVVDFEESTFPLITAPTAASKALELALARNPLEPGKAPKLAIRAGIDAEGVFIETADGLFLKRLVSEPAVQSTSLERAEKGILLRMVSGSGEHRTWQVKGLERTMQFLPGDLDYP